MMMMMMMMMERRDLYLEEPGYGVLAQARIKIAAPELLRILRRRNVEDLPLDQRSDGAFDLCFLLLLLLFCLIPLLRRC
jgi:hypothetical protein